MENLHSIWTLKFLIVLSQASIKILDLDRQYSFNSITIETSFPHESGLKSGKRPMGFPKCESEDNVARSRNIRKKRSILKINVGKCYKIHRFGQDGQQLVRIHCGRGILTVMYWTCLCFGYNTKNSRSLQEFWSIDTSSAPEFDRQSNAAHGGLLSQQVDMHSPKVLPPAST